MTSETDQLKGHPVDIGVAVIWNEKQEILIDQRLAEDAFGGFWEFPGGKLEPDETIEECIKREIKEELDIEIRVREKLVNIDHIYPRVRVILHVYNCDFVSGNPVPIESSEIRWVNVNELDQYQFPPANTRIIDEILNYFSQLSVNQ
jgi:mutator protein MutT